MRRVLYNLKQAFQQIGRNKGMSLASVFAITAMMLILGLFFILSVNVNVFTEAVKSDYDTVEVYLKDSTTEAQAAQIMQELKDVKGVSKVTYRTKEQAMKIMKKRWGDSGYLLNSLGSNPLPNSVLVKVSNLSAANSVNKTAIKNKGVENTTCYKATIDKVTKITNSIQVGALIIMLFLVVVSVVVVSNTIKLTVLARAREIEIMKYIGATNWFIRVPFLIEGIIIGIISALVSSGITYLVYGKLVSKIGLKMMTMLGSPLVPTGYLCGNLVVIFLALGIGIGACGSIVSMRRFLDA
jgi:cell division transport system permease protein